MAIMDLDDYDGWMKLNKKKKNQICRCCKTCCWLSVIGRKKIFVIYVFVFFFSFLLIEREGMCVSS